jgi:hypothetical protein
MVAEALPVEVESHMTVTHEQALMNWNAASRALPTESLAT